MSVTDGYARQGAKAMAMLVAVAIAFIAMLGAAHAQITDLRTLSDTIEATERMATIMRTAVERQRVENERVANALGTAAAGTPTPSIEDLRQAQFEVDITRTRMLTLQHRIAEMTSELESLNAAIVRQSALSTGAQPDTLRAIADEEQLGLRTRLKEAREAVLTQALALLEVTEDTLSWRSEQLSIIQEAASLEALVAGGRTGEPAVVIRLQRLVGNLSEQALALGNAAAAIGDASPGAVARRNALRISADELILRSNARLTDVAIVGTRALLEGVQPLISESAVPVRIFDNALDAVDARAEDLLRRISVTETISEAIGDLREILRDVPEGERGDFEARVERLRTLISTQRTEIAELQDSISSTRDALIRERARRERALLFVRESARTDQEGRTRIAAEMRELPDELRVIYEARYTEVRTAFEVAPRERLFAFAAAVLVTLALMIWLQKRILKRFVKSRATIATEIPLEVLRRNLFWLMLPAIWGIFAAMFAISRETAISIFTLIVIPAAAAFLTDLTAVVVRRRGGDNRTIGRLIMRVTAVAMMMTAVVVFGYAVLAEAPLLPSTESAINRLAYSVFVLAGLPMLLFVVFFAQVGADGQAAILRRLVAATLALLPPVALIATGLTGLLGYKQLAGIMLQDLAIAIAITAMTALAMGVVYDVSEAIAAHLREKDPAEAYFVRQNFIRPGRSIVLVILAIIALVIAGQIFEWNSETLIVAEVLAVWGLSLFTIGGKTYTLGNIIVAVAALVFVFWAAAWVRRVAYSVFLRKLKDIGIRQSLSVFAQYVVIVIGVLLTLSVIGFDVTTLTVFAASLGVGIGFGLQNVVNNFISGLLLLVERPLRLGDIVTVGGSSGTVSQIGIRSMRMRTFDEFDLIVPNSALISDTFTNWTRSNSLMRVLLVVGISYDDAPEHAVQVVEKVLHDHPGVVGSPAPMVTVDEFGDSSVNLRVCYYIDLRGSMSGFRIRSEVLTNIRNRFGEEGLSIPYPQRDIHVLSPSPDDPMPVKAPRRPLVESRPVEKKDTEDDWQADAIEMAQQGEEDPH